LRAPKTLPDGIREATEEIRVNVAISRHVHARLAPGKSFSMDAIEVQPHQECNLRSARECSFLL
jgi:hypothetical protein